jgi:hypothetical protein
MGFRFRKTLRLGGLVRLNFSGSGVSLGLGPRGANINISKRGLRQTVGVPGSGLSYSTFSKWADAPPAAVARPPAVPVALPAGAQQTVSADGVAQGRKSTGFLKFLGAAGVLVALYAIFSQPDPRGAATYVVPTVSATVTATPAVTEPKVPAALQAAQPAPKPAAAAPATPANSSAADSSALAIDEVRELQTWLKAFNLDPGPIDGLMGPLTTAAIKKYEAARERPITGAADRQLLERLRKDTGGTIR